MANPRVHEVAAEIGVDTKVALARLRDMGEFVRSASSSISFPVARKLKASLTGASTAGAGAFAPALRFPQGSARRVRALSRNLPRDMPRLVALLRTATMTALPGSSLPDDALVDRHFYFCPTLPRSEAEGLLGSELPSDAGVALIRRGSAIELLAWSLRVHLNIYRAILRIDQQDVALTNVRRAQIRHQDGFFFVNLGRGDEVAMRRLTDLVGSIPVAAARGAKDSALSSPPVRRAADSQDEVRIVYLRRSASKGQAAVREQVARMSRWTVRGHWRRQWYPSLGGHRRLWIAEHPAGATDKEPVRRDIIYIIRPS